MEDIIKLNSKGEENNYLKRLKKPNGEESKTYVLKVTSPQVFTGKTEYKHKFILPTGGPMIIDDSKFTIDHIEYFPSCAMNWLSRD